ncbi:hypothetical protein EVAR_86201_1 [Eumeta japonica]|uniref:Uncharacterized protein n=1 Tax=Eumeta variegata TaxID=151549 RepID=A0A4C1UD06_EUMVA|nr:hypothetical protein EVAR_86201_1 [Eumeta japonica]
MCDEPKPTKVANERSAFKRMIASFLNKTGLVATVALENCHTVTEIELLLPTPTKIKIYSDFALYTTSFNIFNAELDKKMAVVCAPTQPEGCDRERDETGTETRAGRAPAGGGGRAFRLLKSCLTDRASKQLCYLVAGAAPAASAAQAHTPPEGPRPPGRPLRVPGEDRQWHFRFFSRRSELYNI